MYWLILAVLALAAYAAMKIHALGKAQRLVAEFLEAQFRELRETIRIEKPRSLAYGWFDGGWPVEKLEDEERAPLESPSVANTQDEFADQMWITQYRSFQVPSERIAFLRDLWRSGVGFNELFLDLVYADESAFVRAWAAAHLPIIYKDYSDLDRPVETRNYKATLSADAEAVVGAAMLSNPNCGQLPWRAIWLTETWTVDFQKMSHLEHLALMRNPQLSKIYVVALLDASSDELQISRNLHVEILRSAALNPNLIGSSRMHGRDYWIVEGDVNSPFEEFGKMWDLCIEKWLDQPSVPYIFLKYIQTTPKKKLEIYNKLLLLDDAKAPTFLREAIIKSADPIKDKDVLKVAWNDTNEDCRKAAVERIGGYTKYVGVESAQRA